MRGSDVQAEVGDEPAQTRDLAFGNFHDQSRKRCGVDDRMLEWAFQPPPDEPRVEGVVAVLHQHCAVCEPKECAARVLEDRRANEHRAIDLMTLPRVWIDRRAAIDQSVEERQRAFEGEALCTKLENKKGRVASGLDVEGNELSVVERRERSDLRGVDGYLLPGHQRSSAPGLEEKRL